MTAHVDNRNPEHIPDVFERIGRHLKVMEGYIGAGKKHTWLLMSRDTLDGMCTLHAQLGELIGMVRQVSRQGGTTTQGAQDSLAGIRQEIEAITGRLDRLNKSVNQVMAKQEDLDA